ncbi:nucleotide-binding protein [Agrobacterium rhizogenes]|uniref:Putative nucleotide-binding containing TIR-like domain protein n=1 Tax=Rhizobium rhizogenes TaxID=359 RepID=A0A7S5DQE3_RHIRH|nr:nucleotide-binding protein [Rhizobium rhizogenes]NTI06750.1 nucleotide-binding protein [Rhizobium rhizogenes]NTI13555.1 nucleotide-binding protein [Rhizobium rhizogenes]QCL09939.1 putative nucleotide-binding containing TIR-like domain protein [Rhizobium rhizogenes]
MEVKKIPPFPSRPLVIASANILKAEGHSGFDEMRLEWNLEDTDAGTGSGLAARATSMAAYALRDPELRTPEGISLQSTIVARAGEIYREGYMPNIGDKERSAFKRASTDAGSMNDVSKTGVASISIQGDFLPKPEAVSISLKSKPEQPKLLKRKVFVVHGHDEGAREMVARFLEKIDFEVIILHEQVNRGRTVIEKVEVHGDVSFAVVLLTPDDEGGKVGGNLQPRARQNVILELGYFIGRLGRSNVCALTRDNVEIPSDFAGVVYEPLEGHWRNTLARELEDVGFEIDWKKVSRP